MYSMKQSKKGADSPSSSNSSLSQPTRPFVRQAVSSQNPQTVIQAVSRKPFKIKKKKPDSMIKKNTRRRKTRNKYTTGKHGARKEEQKRLSKIYKIPVTGSGFESEHTVGFEPLARTSGVKRGKGDRARGLENYAPAYQEVKELHRQHIGTGMKPERDESSFNSQEYRDSQRTLLEAGDVSSAVQLNQMGYAYDPNFEDIKKSLEWQASTESYNTMVRNMDSVDYARGDQNVKIPVDKNQRAEMLAARYLQQKDKLYLTEEEKKQFLQEK